MPLVLHWVKQADLDSGRRMDDLSTSERKELARLRCENRRLRMERGILARRLARAVLGLFR